MSRVWRRAWRVRYRLLAPVVGSCSGQRNSIACSFSRRRSKARRCRSAAALRRVQAEACKRCSPRVTSKRPSRKMHREPAGSITYSPIQKQSVAYIRHLCSKHTQCSNQKQGVDAFYGISDAFSCHGLRTSWQLTPTTSQGRTCSTVHHRLLCQAGGCRKLPLLPRRQQGYRKSLPQAPQLVEAPLTNVEGYVGNDLPWPTQNDWISGTASLLDLA